MAIDDSILLLLDREPAGQATPADRARIADWVGGDAVRQAEVGEYRQLIARTRAARPVPEDAQLLLARVRQAVAADTQRPAPHSLRSTGSYIQWRTGPVAAVAAAIVVLLGGVAMIFATHAGHVTQPLREFSTAPGGRATIMLRDGTRLVLGPATHVRIPKDFGRAGRTVELDGEALFSVVHDARHPFAVHTGNTTITDIGTEFDVQAYAEDHATRVAVSVGAVCIGADCHGSFIASSRLLHPGDIAVVTNTGTRITHDADIADLTAWTQGHLVFRDTPLRDVIRQLDRSFDVAISIRDSTLGAQRVTGSYTDQTIDAILTDITAVIGAQFEHTGHTIVIHPRAGIIPGRSTPHPAMTSTLTSR